MKKPKKQKVIFLKGLPASGKSTYAKKLVTNNPGVYKRINKDDLRAMLDCGNWSKKNEQYVLNIRDFMAGHAMRNGWSVIIDDTNLHPKHEQFFAQMAAEYGYEMEVKFFDVPLMECIERDAKRGDKSVGAKVIFNMYEQFLKPKSPEWSESKQNAYVFDIDGTLAKMNGRSPYDYTKVKSDVPNHSITMIARLLKASGLPIIIMSGRPDSCKVETMEWLSANSIPFSEVHMRKEGDSRKDSIIKRELYDEHIAPRFNVLAVFDDRNQVVDMWRALGITCLQVDYGFF